MSDNIVGLAAVIMIFGIPMAAMYTFYRVRKLRTHERIAALARGVDVPMQPDLPEGARSRRFGILLTERLAIWRPSLLSRVSSLTPGWQPPSASSPLPSVWVSSSIPR